MKLFIAGATGLVGSAALSLALVDERVEKVIAPTRRPLPAHPKLVNPLMAQWDPPVQSREWPIDGALCALGTTRAKAGSAAAFRAVDLDLVVSVASWLRAADVERFALTSSLGANSRSPILYSRTKGEAEEAIERLNFPSLTILRPGFLAGERHEVRPLERLVGQVLRKLGPLLPASARVSPVASVAHLVLEAAVGAAPGRHIITSADIARC